MTNYINDLTSEFKNRRDDATRLVDEFNSTKVYFDGTVYRWKSNDTVPPKEIIELWAYFYGNMDIDVEKHDKVRSADLAKFLDEYRKNHTGPSDEERFEARAAHGPGVELVNVITGEKWTT